MSEPTIPDWDGAAYAANTGHHRAFDAPFLERTPLRPGDRVLDLGCGSGDFSATLAGIVGPDGHVLGVDAQPSMLDEARAVAGGNQSFLLGPVERLGELLPSPDHDGTFDLVLSRAALHWIAAADQPEVYRQAFRLTKPGGHVRVECGGASNIPGPLALMNEVSASLGGPSDPWTFADPPTAIGWLEAAGFDITAPGCFVRCEGQRRAFDEASLLGWFRSQVFNAYEARLPAEQHDAFRSGVEARLDELRRADGTWDQTWVRLDLLARRPPGTGS